MKTPKTNRLAVALALCTAALAVSVGLNIRLASLHRRAEASYRASVRIMDAMAERLSDYALHIHRTSTVARDTSSGFSRTVAWAAIPAR